MKHILDRYVFKEISIPLVVGMTLAILCFMIQHSIKITEWIVNRGVPASEVLKLLTLIVPPFLPIIIPQALLFAVLVTLNRLAVDAEITALKAGGISLYRLLPPVLGIGAAAGVVSLACSVYIAPYSERAAFEIFRHVAYTSLDAILTPHTFQELRDDVTILVRERTPEELRGIMIAERGRPGEEGVLRPKDIAMVVLNASTGVVTADEETLETLLRLEDGSIHLSDKDFSGYRVIQFGRLDARIPLPKDEQEMARDYSGYDQFTLDDFDIERGVLDARLQAVRVNPKLTAEEKGARIKAIKKERLNLDLAYHQKFVMAFACVIIGMWGIPLGIARGKPRTSRMKGFIPGFIAVLIYYLILTSAEMLSTDYGMHPGVASWVPNMVGFVVGFYFLQLGARDRPIPGTEAVAAVWRRLLRRVRKPKATE